LTSDIHELVEVSEEARTVLQKKQLLQAFGTIELILQLVQPAKTLFNSAKTAMIVTWDKSETDYFEPHNFLVNFASPPCLQ
jgi:hypothetical protein